MDIETTPSEDQTAPEVAPAPVDANSTGQEPGHSTGQATEGSTESPWNVPEGVVKLKAAGGEHEFRSLQELTKAAQMGIGARKAFTELDELRKSRESWESERATIAQQLQGWVENVKKNPAAFFQEIGLDPMQWSEKQLRQHLDLQAMTPEQRQERARQEQAERELSELRQYKQERETEREKAQREAAEHAQSQEIESARAQLEAEIVKELEADPVLGVETIRPRTIVRVAQVMAESNAAGVYCPPDKAVAYVRAERQAELREHINGMDPEKAIAFFGEDWARSIREYDVKRAKGTAKADAAAKGKGQAKQYGTLAEMLAAEKGVK